MPHRGEHLPEEKPLGGDSGHYRLHGGRHSDSATVAVETSDEATGSTRRDEFAAAAAVAQRTTKRRLQLGMELRRGETNWSHRDDELRRQTTTQQRGVLDGEFLTVRCPMATTAQHQ